MHTRLSVNSERGRDRFLLGVNKVCAGGEAAEAFVEKGNKNMWVTVVRWVFLSLRTLRKGVGNGGNSANCGRE